ncbi:MAG: Rpn family recombination-promoting nuclease/putative transposase, partial [Chitinispirillales bacterium]|nr:Rpn family recombination-promoting nuclease/putative transposase [Chitinispirillales bacterium]
MDTATLEHENAQTANREYKNSVFTLLFGDIAAQLYCAVVGKTYDPAMQVKVTTLTDVLYRGRLNDLSFELDGKLIVLIEHQSTLNANMPLRMLQYITRLYRRYTDGKKAIYGETMLKIPRPEFIVLYNGTKELP